MKETRILCYLHNNGAVLIPKLQKKAIAYNSIDAYTFRDLFHIKVFYTFFLFDCSTNEFCG